MQKIIQKGLDWLILKGFFAAQKHQYTQLEASENELIQYNYQYGKVINPQLINLRYFDFLKQGYNFNNQLFEIKNAFIHAESGGLLIDKKIFKPSFFNNYWYIISAGIYRYLFVKDKNAAKIEQGFLLTGNMSYNFYHFLIDSLPRVMDYLKLREKYPDLKLIINHPQPFCYDYLELLGINRDNCIFLDKNATVSQLFASNNKHSLNKPLHLYSNFVYSKARLQQFAHFLIQKSQPLTPLKIKTGQKIYISRRDAGTRVVINEAEVFEYLQKQGFEFILLSELSIAAQIQLFANAQCIVTAHGAGLANLIYAQNALIIEFFPCNKNLATLYQMQQLSQVNENKHILFVCGEVTTLQDVSVDIQQLKLVWKTENQQ